MYRFIATQTCFLLLCTACVHTHGSSNVPTVNNSEIQALLDQVEQHLTAGELTTALTELNKVISLYPDHFDYYRKRGNIYYKQHKYKLAESDWKRAITLASDSDDVYGNLGIMLLINGRAREAKEYCRKAYELNPNCIVWAVNLGHAYLLQNDEVSAEKYYRKGLTLLATQKQQDHGILANFDHFLAKGWQIEACRLWRGWFFQGLAAIQKMETLWDAAIKSLLKGHDDDCDDFIVSAHNAIKLWEKFLETENPIFARNLTTLAYAYDTLDRYTEAEPLYKRALQIREKTLGLEHPDTVNSLHNLAGIYSSTGRYAEAETLYKKALQIREKKLGPKHPDVAKTLDNLAQLCRRTGRYAAAEPLYKRALEIWENTLGTEHPDIVNSLDNLAGLYASTGRYGEAESLYKRALQITEKTFGSEHPNVVTILNSLAAIYDSMGRWVEAEALSIRALQITENSLLSEPQDIARSINNLACIYQSTGRYVESETLFKKALIITENALGPKHLDTASSLGNLAGLYCLTGRYAEAEKLCKKVLILRENALGPEHPVTAHSLNNLAALYEIIGRYTEAQTLYKKSLIIIKKALGHEHPDVATILDNLACIYQITERYTDAEELYKISRKIRENSLGQKHPSIVYSLNNIATLYEATDRYAEAEILYKQALIIQENALGHEHPDVATILNNLAKLYHLTGRYAEAESLYKKALKIASHAGSPELLYDVPGSYSNLLARQNNTEASIFLAKQAVNTIQSLRSNVAALGKETLQSFTGTVKKYYKHLADLLISQGRLAEAQQVLAMLKEEEYFSYLRRDSSEAKKLDTQATFIPPEIPWDKEYKKLLADSTRTGQELQHLRQIDSHGMLRANEKTRLKELETLVREQDIAFNDFLTRLLTGLQRDVRAQAAATEGKIFTVNQEITSTLQKALASLGHGAVLLQYLITEDRVRIMLTTPDQQIETSSEIKAPDLNKKLFAFREVLQDPHKDPRPLGKELYDILIAPMLTALQDAHAETLMLYQEGSLRYIPFAALFDGEDYLTRHYRTVLYADAARQTITLPVRPDWTVAAMGVSEKVHPDFVPLPSVPQELDSIVLHDGHGALPGEIRLNQAFTENALAECAGHNPVLHIASHFSFTPGVDTDSFLLLGDGSAFTLDKVRSGSAFGSAELLTLSACETAMGTTGNGREIEGFGALAMNSGTKAVIATLWSIADASTAQLMSAFYQHHETDHLTKAESLRQAQLSLLGHKTAVSNGQNRRGTPVSTRKSTDAQAQTFTASAEAPYAHPFYWAPFILMGNWK